MFGIQLSKFVCIRKFPRSPRCLLGLQSLLLDNHCLTTLDTRHLSKKKDLYTSPNVPTKDSEVITGKFKINSSSKKKIVVEERENIWTIPNILCCTRIAFSPYLGALICDGQFNLAFYVMIFVGLTDVLDGLIARTFTSQSSKFGTFLDPLADKILVTTTCITLTIVNLIPVPLTVLIVSRDVALAAAAFYIRYKSLPPPKTFSRYFDATHVTAKLEPTTISKFNTVVQLAAIGTGLISPVIGFVEHPALIYLWCFTASTTVASAISYFYEIDKYQFKN